MHEVTCTHCGQVLQISPDACRCSRCGEDLRALIPPHRTAGYFYRRSADLAARGDLPSALAEAERGLSVVESSELRLLAGILAKRIGDPDTVRAHVSAIPVDDRLRQEAEWLIRSQTRRSEALAPAPPSRQAPAPQATVAETAAAANAQSRQATAAAAQQKPGRPANSATPVPRSALWAQRIWGFVALVMLIIVGAMGWTLVSGGPDALLALVPGLVEGTPNRIEAEPSLRPVTPAPLVLPTPTPRGGVLQAEGPLLVITPEPVVEAVQVTPVQEAPFDLRTVLEAAGRSDLASLPVSANVESERVRLTGVVTSTAERLALIDLVQQVSGVREVHATDLVVRIPPTYVVQPGDSLWSIANQFYGEDPAQVSMLFEANRDVLPSAQSLQVGMELRLPQAP